MNLGSCLLSLIADFAAGGRAARRLSTDCVVVGPPPKQDDGHPKQRLNRLVGLVYAPGRRARLSAVT